MDENTRRERLAAMLHMLPKTLHRALLDDESAKSRLGIQTRPVTTIRDGVAFESAALEQAVRNAFSTGEEVELATTAGQAVRLKADHGAILVSLEKERFRLADLGVLASEKEQRIGALAEFENSMLSTPPTWDDLRARIEAAPQGMDVLDKLTELVSASPLRQTASLERKLADNALGFIDLCPLALHYWAPLIGAPQDASASAAALMPHLNRARELMIAHSGLSKAAPYLFASSGSYALSPRALLERETEDTIASCIPNELDRAAPFSLIAILETAGGRPAHGLLDAGAARVVKHILENWAWLTRASEAFTAMFRVCIAQLSTSPELGPQSWAWQRLAAFSQANIVTPLLVKDWNQREEFVRWMRANSVVLYRLRTALDANVAPRWRDDWIEPPCVRAEILGRLRQIRLSFPESAKRWGLSDSLEALIERAEEESLPQASRFAGPLEGDRESAPRAAPDDSGAIEKAYVDALRADPGFTQLARVIYAAATAPALAGLRAAIEDATKSVSVTLLRNPESSPIAVLLSLGWAAAVFSSTALAEQVLRLTIGLDDDERDKHVDACCITLLYAAGAFADTEARLAFIKRSFEGLANSVSDKNAAWGLLEIIRNGLSIDPALDRLLASAAIASRLAAMRR